MQGLDVFSNLVKQLVMHVFLLVFLVQVLLLFQVLRYHFGLVFQKSHMVSHHHFLLMKLLILRLRLYFHSYKSLFHLFLILTYLSNNVKFSFYIYVNYGCKFYFILKLEVFIPLIHSKSLFGNILSNTSFDSFLKYKVFIFVLISHSLFVIL